MEHIKTICIFVGTRPEIIKMAPVITTLRNQGYFKVEVCSSGQHEEMGDQAFSVFGIHPDENLHVMRDANGLPNLTSLLIERISEYLARVKPTAVLVHGDTATAFAAALSSYYAQVPVIHVEAGLRTGNIHSPWPEEGYRSMIAKIATLHFAPTQTSYKNLVAEGCRPENIHVVGNTVIDALMYVAGQFDTGVSDLKLPVIDNFVNNRIILLTGHRRENLDGGLHSVFTVVRDLVERYQDVAVVIPAHLNPVVREQLAEVFPSQFDRIAVIEPLSYTDFVYALKKSFFVITDSGGVQEEAPSLGKPVVVIRDTTERPEAVEAGTVVLTGTDYARVMAVCERLLTSADYYNKISFAHNPYGDGESSKRIADVITSYFYADTNDE